MYDATEKRKALALARDFLGRNEASMLRHAALELRRSIEVVVDQKLAIYQDRLPATARRWQPPQAFKALIAIEPEAAHTTKVGWAWEKEKGVPSSGPFHLLGVDRRPDVGWLSKTYNKLGNLLHAELPFGPASLSSKPAEAREFLESTASALEPFVEASLTHNFALTVTFTCIVCNSPVIASQEGVQKNRFATCLNPECEARYQVEEGEDGFLFTVEQSRAQCPACKEGIDIPDCKVRVGHEVVCPSCGARSRIDHLWTLCGIEEKEQGQAAQPSS